MYNNIRTQDKNSQNRLRARNTDAYLNDDNNDDIYLDNYKLNRIDNEKLNEHPKYPKPPIPYLNDAISSNRIDTNEFEEETDYNEVPNREDKYDDEKITSVDLDEQNASTFNEEYDDNRLKEMF